MPYSALNLYLFENLQLVSYEKDAITEICWLHCLSKGCGKNGKFSEFTKFMYNNEKRVTIADSETQYNCDNCG